MIFSYRKTVMLKNSLLAFVILGLSQNLFYRPRTKFGVTCAYRFFPKNSRSF